MKNQSPQLKKGFIRIASGKEENDILTALIKARLNSTEYQIVLLIIRKTWGFNKKEDWISLTQFSNYTSKTIQSVVSALNSLLKKNIVLKKTLVGKISSYQFNKRFDEWKTLLKKTILLKKTLMTTKENFNPLLKKTIDTIDIYTKDTNTKDINKQIIPLFKEINPSYERIFSNITQRQALIRLIKKYGEEWVISLIKKLPTIINQPYAPRITTPYELEAKLGQLKVFLQQEKLKNTKIGSIKV